MTSDAIIKMQFVNEYNNSKIYKIYNSINKKVYIGSTTRDLHNRFIEHKSKANTKLGRKCSSSIIINEDPENCKIELIEKYPCNNVSRLRAREAYWKNKLNCININIPSKFTIASCGGSIKEWRKNYKKENKEKIKQYDNEKFICACKGKYTRKHKAQHEKTKLHQKYLNDLNH